MSESINKIKVKDITYDVEDSVARAGLDKVLLFESITWAGLKSLKDNGNLAPGTKYRITDYITTTTQENTISAGNQFDIIVEALTENTLNELASACLHEGDTYFSSNGCVLEAWQLWYDIENDTEKYEWADTENGKGVIYRMIDEKRNDCPYDFKNILFYTANYTSNTTSDKYYYTFSYVVSGVLYDGTVEKRTKYCCDNSIGMYTISGKSRLNGNIFKNISFNSDCQSNSFGNDCHSNSFGYNCYYNTFGNDCYSNSFGHSCRYNSFGTYCNYNSLGNDCYYNSLGNGCQHNSFGNGCHNNSFGSNCSNNSFGSNCYYNSFGDSCYYNSFGGFCRSNNFGIGCSENSFADDSNLNSFENTTSNRNFFDRDHDRISITLNEEYYDDGTNTLVPTKHPDLSTQPSILPYKFMGQYVYEQLIPINNVSTVPISLLTVDNPIILECFYIGIGYVAPCEVKVIMLGEENYIKIEVRSSDAPSSNGLYYKIVYTSMPKEGGDYYGYNNY